MALLASSTNPLVELRGLTELFLLRVIDLLLQSLVKFGLLSRAVLRSSGSRLIELAA